MILYIDTFYKRACIFYHSLNRLFLLNKSEETLKGMLV